MHTNICIFFFATFSYIINVSRLYQMKAAITCAIMQWCRHNSVLAYHVNLSWGRIVGLLYLIWNFGDVFSAASIRSVGCNCRSIIPGWLYGVFLFFRQSMEGARGARDDGGGRRRRRDSAFDGLEDGLRRPPRRRRGRRPQRHRRHLGTQLLPGTHQSYQVSTGKKASEQCDFYLFANKSHKG